MKYKWTTEIDNRIREFYRNNDGKRKNRKVPYVKDFARSLGLPSWLISKRARDIGAYEPRLKEPPWSEKELMILERNTHHHPESIRRNLLKAGFKRSMTGIIVKRKRMRFVRGMDGQSATKLAECFGVDPHTITRWIKEGLLKAQMRGTERTEQQGGDIYYIKDKWVKDFVIENIGLIDIRKVDKFYFIDVVTS